MALFFKHRFLIESSTGNYTINGNTIAVVDKEWFKLSDTYGVDKE